MIIVTCADQKNGVLFNRRRQSQDRAVRRRLLDRIGGGRLLMLPGTAGQFAAEIEAGAADIQVRDTFPGETAAGDLWFVEGVPLTPVAAEIEAVVLYRWNRVYPADTFLDLDLTGPDWAQTACTVFAGHAHEEITEEVYERRRQAE